MRIIKRNGSEQNFEPSKIQVAITKAYRSVNPETHVPEDKIRKLTESVVEKIRQIPHTPGVEEVQDIVEDALMDSGDHEVARSQAFSAITWPEKFPRI